MANILPQNTFDVIVIGVGSMGSSTCYHMAKRGYKVLGLEQFDIPHELGSHAGQTRIIRKSYGEATNYVPLLERAYENWSTLEEETGTQVFFKNGMVYFGTPDSPFLQTVKESSVQYNIPINQLSAEECREKYPQFNLPSNFERLEEPNAGFLTPERCILLMVQQALFHGATIKTREKVTHWKQGQDTITLNSDKATYHAKKLIITAGPWTSKLATDLAPKLTITRQPLAWVQPKKWMEFDKAKFPCWLIRNGGRDFYGFPIVPVGQFGGPLGLKLGMHHPGGEATDPDKVDRTPREADEKALVEFLEEFIPDGYQNTLVMKTCLYTKTVDEHFIVDFLPNSNKNIVVASGFSGHGFKFVSVIGEVLVDLAIEGSTNFNLDFLSLTRFTAKKN
ncbi:N-methyl-L-tryptophan oxidase [Croceivirga thetidis]|uniref:N-methyl-L-tryptophan oxidase n=1 Tax=Croceivirga thetidis TaxID=2721623 RepID=A0ABX1GS08_9FLAO|nr:N-methyl-L-tryptophan oxidase [Croceivirga thetidis]NKI31825.1 N-methyl-L-tryptophan oxidase [Croceivirga thetidis]